MTDLRAQALTADAFAPFGDVIDTALAAPMSINDGSAQRFDDLAGIDVADGGGRPNVSIFVSRPRPAPVVVDMVERHPLGSQLFIPLGKHPYLVVVAVGSPPFTAKDLCAFLVDDGRGVNYRKGTWHLPLCALWETGRFLVIDRGGPGDNCDEYVFPPEARASVLLERDVR